MKLETINTRRIHVITSPFLWYDCYCRFVGCVYSNNECKSSCMLFGYMEKGEITDVPFPLQECMQGFVNTVQLPLLAL